MDLVGEIGLGIEGSLLPRRLIGEFDLSLKFAEPDLFIVYSLY